MASCNRLRRLRSKTFTTGFSDSRARFTISDMLSSRRLYPARALGVEIGPCGRFAISNRAVSYQQNIVSHGWHRCGKIGTCGRHGGATAVLKEDADPREPCQPFVKGHKRFCRHPCLKS